MLIQPRLLLVLLLIPLLQACSGDRISPEDQIRQMLSAGEQAVESRSLSEVGPYLSGRYSDDAGRQKRAVLRLLAGYFISHQSIHLLTQVSRIELIGDTTAEVTLFVAAAAQPIASTTQFLTLRADLFRFDLVLSNDQGEWQVLSGSWRRAEKKDFLE